MCRLLHFVPKMYTSLFVLLLYFFSNKQTKFPVHRGHTVNTKIKVHSAENPGLSKDPIRKPGKGQSIIASHASSAASNSASEFPPLPC